MPIEKWVRYTCARCGIAKDFVTRDLLSKDLLSPRDEGWEIVGGKKGLVFCAGCFILFQSFVSGARGLQSVRRLAAGLRTNKGKNNADS